MATVVTFVTYAIIWAGYKTDNCGNMVLSDIACGILSRVVHTIGLTHINYWLVRLCMAGEAMHVCFFQQDGKRDFSQPSRRNCSRVNKFHRPEKFYDHGKNFMDTTVYLSIYTSWRLCIPTPHTMLLLTLDFRKLSPNQFQIFQH